MQKIKIYLILLSVLLVLGLISLVLIVNTYAPDKLSSIVLFYFLVFLTIFAAATIAGFYIRRLFGQREFLGSYASSASRQGVWLGLIFVISLLLMHNGLFTWINAALMVATFVFLESYLLTIDKSNDTYYDSES